MPVRKQPTDPFHDSPAVPSPFDRQHELAQAAAAQRAQRQAQADAQRMGRDNTQASDSTSGDVGASRQGSLGMKPQASAQDRTPDQLAASQQNPASARSIGRSSATKEPWYMKAMRHVVQPVSSRERVKGSGSPLLDFIQQFRTYILGVVIVVVLVAVGIVAFASFLNDSMSDELAEQRYVSPYDWSKLNRADNRFSYVVDGQERSRLGIDVSENQHDIDWDAVAADGIDFAMIRLGYRGATEGDLYLDDRFEENLADAKNAGIDCGIYFFSQANTPEEAREEADFVLRNLQGAELEYPIAFDSEEKVVGITHSRTHGLDTAQMTAIAEAFCSRIEQAGYDTIVYGNRNDISRYKRSSIENRDIWWAEYGVPTPTAKIDFIIWQYSNVGRVNGITGDVDMNIDLTHALD